MGFTKNHEMNKLNYSGKNFIKITGATMENKTQIQGLMNLDLIQKIALGAVSVYVLITPLLFTTLTAANVFDFPKWIITVSIAILLSILASIKYIQEGKITLASKGYLIPLVGFLLAIGLSIGFSPTNKIMPLMGKGGLLIALIIITLNSIVLLKDKAKLLVYPLFASAFILSWIQILTFFDVMKNVSDLAIFSNETFTPLGSQLSLSTLLATTTIITAVMGFKAKQTIGKMAYFLISGIQSVALIFSVTMLLPGQSAAVSFLPLTHGWSIAIDQLKNWTTALFGLGPDNFSVAFTAFRPAVLNNSDQWFIRYSTSSNEWLTLLTTLGVVGLTTFILLAIKLISEAKSKFNQSSYSAAISLATIGLIFSTLFMPANFATLFLLFILVIMMAATSESQSIQLNIPNVSYVASALIVIVALVTAYYAINMSRAEIAFGQSLKYAAENRGTETYNAQIEAIELNPYIYRYRVAYSNTNLALANSLASKEEITDDDRQTITKLISQSIREGKAAVALNPLNSQAWVNLANIYRQLINFAQGANQWAISSYIQAIRLDKTNPQLRLDLGGLLFSLNQYEDAIDQYKQAISLKPNMANAYYNLSYAYSQLERYPEAFAAMQNVVNLVDPSSADYEKAVSELRQLQELLPQQQAAQPQQQSPDQDSELSLPEPVPTPGPQGTVEFNDQETAELGPDEVTPLDETTVEEVIPESTQSAQPTEGQADSAQGENTPEQEQQ